MNATDLGLVRGLIPTSPIDPNITAQVRSDVDNDDDIDDTDLDLARGKVGNDARSIPDPDPSCP